MSRCSTMPSGEAPVILQGLVHLPKQWIKNHPEARLRGLRQVTAERTKKKKHWLWSCGFQQGTFLKAIGQGWPPPVIAGFWPASVELGFTAINPRDHDSWLTAIFQWGEIYLSAFSDLYYKIHTLCVNRDIPIKKWTGKKRKPHL